MITQIEIVENLLKLGEYNKMFRINYNGLRIYIQEFPFAYYSGLTGALSASRFNGDKEGKILKNWRESMIDSFGQKATDNYIELTADFGTLLHMAIVTIKNKGQIVWGEERDKAFEYFVAAFKDKELEPNVSIIKKTVYEYQKHVASLLQFVFERVHEIYAVETPAKCEHLRIATPIDLFCKCRQTDKGEFKNTTINIKTSSQISSHQMEQAACEFSMWNETYGDAECTAILRTKDWVESKAPTYEYKYLIKPEAEQTSLNAFKRMELCLNSPASYILNPISKQFEGITKIGERPIITQKTIEQEWTEAKELEVLI